MMTGQVEYRSSQLQEDFEQLFMYLKTYIELVWIIIITINNDDN